jgi:hypothetical protein
MAHFAKLDENNNVIAVHVVNNDVLSVNGSESEQAGIDFLINLYNHQNWKQTSYNGKFRKQYAGIGCIYNSDLDMFISPKPFKSWTLNLNGDWEAPVAYPTDGNRYTWNEENLAWEAINEEGI